MKTRAALRLFIALLLLNITTGYVNADTPTAGQLLSYSIEKRFPAEELRAFFKKHQIPKVVLPVSDGINIYEVIYTSTYADGSIVKASGLLFVPMATGKKLPLLIYDHGTEICRDRSCDFTGEQIIGLAFATDGYVVMIPDYMGLGKGGRDQLYLNANAEATASVDMLIASRKLLNELQIPFNKQLFVTGYSQGGHAAMATARLLQEKYADRFPVTAAAPMSGPYDVESTVYNSRNKKYSYPGFLFLLLQSYFIGTGGHTKDMATILNPPYDTLIPPLINGETDIDDINNLMPDSAFSVVKPKFYKAFETDSASPFREYLRANNVYNWKPEMPLMMCYCNGDEEVNYQNTITAYNTMIANGSNTVEEWQAGKKFGHVNCALFAVVYSKMFFDGYRDGHPGTHGPAFKRLLLNLGKLGVSAM